MIKPWELGLKPRASTRECAGGRDPDVLHRNDAISLDDSHFSRSPLSANGGQRLGEPRVADINGNHQRIEDSTAIRTSGVGAALGRHLDTVSGNVVGRELRGAKAASDFHIVVVAWRCRRERMVRYSRPGWLHQVAVSKDCGDCSLCCKTVGIAAMESPAGEWCKMARPEAKGCVGCSIYTDRPEECRNFDCGWLVGKIPEELYPPNVGAVVTAGIPGLKSRKVFLDPNDLGAIEPAASARLAERDHRRGVHGPDHSRRSLAPRRKRGISSLKNQVALIYQIWATPNLPYGSLFRFVIPLLGDA